MNEKVLDRFNKERNKDKSVATLKGILRGINSDNELNSLEINFLNLWLIDNQYLQEDSDVKDILCAIESILKQERLTKEASSDLLCLIDDILEWREDFDFHSITELSNELIGILTGITSDKKIVHSEFDTVIRWLNENPKVSDRWPFTLISKRINQILEDGVIEDEELKGFYQLCKDISGNEFSETGYANAFTTEVETTELDYLPKNWERICFTGGFISGTRSYQKKLAEELELTVVKNVTKTLNVLVLGSFANINWINTSFGRKIQMAQEYRAKNIDISIITEQTWLNLISK